jgi:glycosyltransferase involved in cell wall biosynthesis
MVRAVPTPPRASIVLPVRDAADTLRECLASIAAQTESALECVVVDDGSRDASPMLAHEFARADPRFRVVAMEHGGVARATNRGLAETRAPVVLRMDADDRMHPERVAAQLAALAADASLDLVGAHVRYFPREELGPGIRAYEAWLNGIVSPRDVREAAFVECPLANPTLAWRRQRLGDAPYREDLPWPEDYDLVLRLLQAGRRLAVVPRVLHEWRRHPLGLTSTDPAYADERFIACKAHYLAAGFLARHPRYHLWGYGRTGRLLAKALRAHDRKPASIVELHPGRIGHTIQGAAVVPPARLGPPRGIPLLVCVAGREPRRLIRQELERMGWRVLVDAVFAA